MSARHAATVCATLEGEIRAAISRTQSAIREAQAAVQGMLDIPRSGTRRARPAGPLHQAEPNVHKAA
jgi:hypothetical protein